MNTDNPLPPETQDFSSAVHKWSAILGPENVHCDSHTLDHYSQSTLPSSTRPLAVIRPGSRDEVSQIVVIAAKHRIPLYPISCGKNWGYGDACAVTDGQVIVNLSRMNRIVEVDPTLAYAVIEPGVTQQQLHDYLQENDYPLWLDATGAGPDASVVGNTLERGFGHTPYGNRFQYTCGLEVVLADGRVLKTGFDAYENARASRVFSAGLGPWLDGLFTQSNMGIVTQMGLWLLPAPPVCQGFALKVSDDRGIEAIVEALRPLRLMDVVRSTVHIANDLRVISAQRQYPWELTGGATPLPHDVRCQLRREAGLGAWNVMGGLYGTKETVAAARKVIRRGFRHLAHVHFFGSRELKLGLTLGKLLGRIGFGRRFAETIQSADSVYQLLKGSPSADHLGGVFWRTKTKFDDTCPCLTESGVAWLAPVLPMTASACREVLNLIEPVLRRYRFDPLITMIAVTSRALLCILSICYNKQDPEDTEHAAECYDSLFDLLLECGYIPYRVGIQSMRKLEPQPTVFWDVVQRISTALDPQGILAPGRYQPRRAATGKHRRRDASSSEDA